MVYQGSKTKYAKYIVPILQQTLDVHPSITTFVDVCCGGCNIIDKISAPTRIAIDANPYLIALYEYALSENPIYPECITREDWDRCKNHADEIITPWYVGLVQFFASYSARGFAGGYCLNSDRDYYHERLRNFLAQVPNLQGVQFYCQNVLDISPTDCVIYVDPPYKNTKRYDINKNFDYNAFWQKMRELSQKNIVYISEQEAPDDFVSVWSLQTKRNCFGSGVKIAQENLFVYVNSADFC